MRCTILFFLVSVALAEGPDLPRDVAAAHPSCVDEKGNWKEGGRWKVRKADLYRHIVRYYKGYPGAQAVLPDYMRRRLIEAEARKRKITVTDRAVEQWMAQLDKRIRERTGGVESLDTYRKRYGMSEAELKRRGRLGVQRERVARAIVNERDKTRDKSKALDESTVVLVVDELFGRARKVVDPRKLDKGIVATINGVKITEYQYGRELSFSLPATQVLNALRDLILVREVEVLVGDDLPPSAEDLATEKEWFVDFEMNRLRRLAQAQAQKGAIPKINRSMVDQVLAKRGLTLDQALSNPGSRAQARARGHFRRACDDAALRSYYEANKERFGDELRVARILIAARAQRVGQIGKKVRTLERGKADAQAIWMRATQGEEFAKLAKENSDDVDVIKKNGGVVPFLLTADAPGYQDSWAHANGLKMGGISKPYFSQGRGYVIVKLLDRKKALGFEAMRKRIRREAAEQAYRTWRATALRKAVKSQSLLDK